MFREKLKALRVAMEREKIERYALLIAKIQISGTIPDEITSREFYDIALWDAIATRSREIEEQLRKQMGVIGVIDSASALAPKGDGDVPNSK